MAAEMSPSHNGVQNELVPERPLMSVHLLSAVMEGNEDVIMKFLGLSEERKDVKVQMEASESEPATQQTMTEYTAESELQSATCFGDTVLHLLVTKGHNVLALKVFQKDMSLLKAKNKMLDTPLHCAAKVGNEKIIEDLVQHHSSFVKDVLRETNDNGDTALHIAAKYGNADVGRMLMRLNQGMTYKVNKEKSSPLLVAIANDCREMVMAILEKDATLACIQDSNGMFPVHVAACIGSHMVVDFFMEKFPKYAEFLDPRGRNILHIAAEHNHALLFFLHESDSTEVREMVIRMNNARDYEGNTPLHIAAMKGHKRIIEYILEKKMHEIAESVSNKQGLTAFHVYSVQQLKTSEGLPFQRQNILLNDVETKNVRRRLWLNQVTSLVTNKWERLQVFGLGSVLITTVTFAAAFTTPGGYKDDGTPILARKYIFRAFTLANVLAFITSFLSLLTIFWGAHMGEPDIETLNVASILFLAASSSMLVAFGLGLYVTLAPSDMAIAILILVVTLFLSSPCMNCVPVMIKHLHKSLQEELASYSFPIFLFVNVLLWFAPLLLIFCLSFV